MNEIKQIRELHIYKKMYQILSEAIEQAIKICDNKKINDILTIGIEKTYKLYSIEKTILSFNLSPEELVIIYLLEFIRDREIFQSFETQNAQILNESVNWILALRNIDATLSEDEINERIHKIFHEYLEQNDTII